jgi:acetyl esterase/lipase
MPQEPAHLRPFVLDVPHVPAERHGDLDVYRPAGGGSGKRPAVVFVHGGPVPAGSRPTPRDWPVYRGYGSAAAQRGLIAVTVDHRLHDLGSYPAADDDVRSAVSYARSLGDVDGEAVALWFFSGGGLLMAPWLASPPSWLRCVAATYPILAPLPGWDVAEQFQPITALPLAGKLPLLLTRVGRERPSAAGTVAAFVAQAAICGASLQIIDVPDGQHGFDTLDHDEDSRRAVREALSWVQTALRPGS